jgi:hypothetical protein
MKPKLKPTGTGRLKLKCDILLSCSAFKFNLRRYNWVLRDFRQYGLVGRCKIEPMSNIAIFQQLIYSKYDEIAFTFCLKFQHAPLQPGG